MAAVGVQDAERRHPDCLALGGYVFIVSESGDIARISVTDVNQSNGVIHVVNKVLLPK